MNIFQLVQAHAESWPDKVAVIDHSTELSYSGLVGLADRLASVLCTKGMGLGCRLAFFCPNDARYALVLLAAAKLGLVLVPLPLTLKGDALKQAITGADCDVAIAWPSVAQRLIEQAILPEDCVIRLSGAGRESLENLITVVSETIPKTPGNEVSEHALEHQLSDQTVDAESDFIFTLTSGSTGTPKPIVLTQETKIRRAFDATVSVYDLGAQDVSLVSTPLYHSLALRALLMPLMLGARAVILPKFSVPSWLKAVSEYRASFVFAVSSQLIALAENTSAEYDLSCLRHIVSSSATLSTENKVRLLEWRSEYLAECQLHECYGTSEMGVVSSIVLSDDAAPVGSVGQAIPGVNIKICDTAGLPLPCGDIGQIACSSPNRFKAYYRQPEQTQAALDPEGYFLTGDLGYLDEQGYLYFSGRQKEVIKTGGISVFPQDIEACYQELEGIHACAALGVDDDKFGEIIVLAYEADQALDPKILMAHGLAQLTDYQQPRVFRHFESFPRTELGKVLKPAIRKDLG